MYNQIHHQFASILWYDQICLPVWNAFDISWVLQSLVCWDLLSAPRTGKWTRISKSEDKQLTQRSSTLAFLNEGLRYLPTLASNPTQILQLKPQSCTESMIICWLAKSPEYSLALTRNGTQFFRQCVYKFFRGSSKILQTFVIHKERLCIDFGAELGQDSHERLVVVWGFIIIPAVHCRMA